MEKKFVDALEAEAWEQLAEIRAYRTYRGQNPEYRQRNDRATTFIGHFIKLKGTLAHERRNELISERTSGKLQGNNEDVRALPEGV